MGDNSVENWVIFERRRLISSSVLVDRQDLSNLSINCLLSLFLSLRRLLLKHKILSESGVMCIATKAA